MTICPDSMCSRPEGHDRDHFWAPTAGSGAVIQRRGGVLLISVLVAGSMAVDLARSLVEDLQLCADHLEAAAA